MLKAMVIGAQHMSGTSARTGNDYDMKQILLLSGTEGVDSANRVLRPIGMTSVEMDLSPEAFEQMAAIKTSYPVMMELQESTQLLNGRATTVITSVKVVTPAKSL